MFYHLAAFQKQGLIRNNPDLDLLSGIWDRGWVGVDLFFVISGFIMVYVTQNSGYGISTARRFIRSRVTRIYPLWWACAGIMLVYFLVTYGMPAAPDRIESPDQAIGYAIRSFLLIPQDSVPILGLGWTLIHEMYFYLVFAIILLLPRKFLWPALIVWAGFILASIVLLPSLKNAVMKTAMSPLTIEFILGAAAALMVTKQLRLNPALITIAAATAILLGMLFYPMLPDMEPAIRRVLIFALPCAALAYGWSRLEIMGRAKPSTILTTLGDWSYSLYLTHFIVFLVLRRLFDWSLPLLPENIAEALTIGTTGALDNLVFAIISLPLCILVAALFYRLIEAPAVRFFKRRRVADKAG